MAKKAGRFITLEGGEGAGKSTQAKRLVEALAAKKIDAIITREPGGSPGAEQIRKLLVEGEPGRWDALTETLMMFAARTDHVARTIKPALADGTWVICDRFTDSTYAYQGAGRGLPREVIRRIESVALQEFKPDLTLILDLPVEVGLERANARRGKETRFEKFDLDFHKTLQTAFRDIANRAPTRCSVIDASGSLDDVAALILKAVKDRLKV
ncbi:MAG TPA: dTMP kinase [Rhizomicrobium sp.]|jgi:dTMP kinase|nr:dTMP kinase [Rhizomicrobium sp.]